MQSEKVFKIWTHATKEKIEVWRQNLIHNGVKSNLDFTLDSLQWVEEYLLNNYTIDCLKDQSYYQELDRIVSYIGETIKKLMTNSIWKIFLDDSSNLYYGLPTILTKYSGAISPHFLIREILTLKTNDVLITRIQKAQSYEKLIYDQLKINKL